jgi:hypothetical protein
MSSQSLPLAVSVTHEAYWSENMFGAGIGWVIIIRFKAQGRRLEASIFCIDLWCLGVKVAAFEEWDITEYSERINALISESPVKVDPCCARKFVEQGVRYAERLGFQPHPDFKKAARVWGGVKAENCTRQFTFGDGGKPHYFSGPRETTAQSMQIVRQLERNCGQGNFNFTILGNEDMRVTSEN